jgi:tripartite-type tricarboxylate transporter receptor subunit TctC
MNRWISTIGVSAALLALAVPAAAQNYPAKPIKIVVPFPAGDTSDVLDRLLGQKMTES